MFVDVPLVYKVLSVVDTLYLNICSIRIKIENVVTLDKLGR